MKIYTPKELLGPLNDVEARNAPKELFIAGDVSLIDDLPRIAVIGTRKPSNMGEARAARLVKELVKANAIVISGLAEGIDTIAHCTAIEKGGRTIAVLGTPLNKVYPKKNHDLQQEIMQSNLAISQFPDGYPIQPRNFPMRNRTMALISHMSVIIEAGEGSGTHSQGWESLRLGRPLFILRSVVNNPSLNWPNKMIEYGAITLSDPDILLENLPISDNSDDRNVTL